MSKSAAPIPLTISYRPTLLLKGNRLFGILIEGLSLLTITDGLVQLAPLTSASEQYGTLTIRSNIGWPSFQAWIHYPAVLNGVPIEIGTEL
ncbi:MAG: hypothetical protein ABSC65_31400 [Acidobacteriaceae bacterium]|jgi:hypothetical protein